MIFNIEIGMKHTTPTLKAEYPADVTASGNSASFTIFVDDEGFPKDYALQWFVNGEAVEGATEATYVRDTSGDKGVLSVWCEVTNKAGTTTSRRATLTVNKTPVLNGSYPANASVTVNSSTTLKVTVSEDGYPNSYTYQWYKNGTAISGATGSTYTFTPTTVGTSTLYCKVTNAAGTVTSRTATITASALYLYKNGDECTSITGGWGWVTIPGYYLDTSECSKSNGALEAYTTWDNQTAAYAQTNRAVDLSKFRTLTFVVTDVDNVAEIGCENTSGNEVANVEIARAGTYNLDISSVKQSCYVYAGYANDVEDYYFGCTVTQIYLS